MTRIALTDLDSKALPILDAASLLSGLGLDGHVQEIRHLAGIDARHFDRLYLPPIHRYSESVQLLPGSIDHHHKEPGGLLRHTLELIVDAMKRRKGRELPLGASPETREHEYHQWTYGTFAAALLHDIGKAVVYRIRVTTPSGEVCDWTPHDRPLRESGAKKYTVEFTSAPYEYHQQLALTFYADLIPAVARGWLATNQRLMRELVACLWGDDYESGMIGEMVLQADRASVSRDLNLKDKPGISFPTRLKPPYEYLMMALRHLIAEREIPFNRNGAMGWTGKDGYTYLVCRKVIEVMQAYLTELGAPGIPNDRIRCFDILLDAGCVIPTDEGKAVWTVEIKCDDYTHRFTVLKFETRRLFRPGHMPSDFEGTISPYEGDAEETLQEQNSNKRTNSENNSQARDKESDKESDQSTEEKSAYPAPPLSSRRRNAEPDSGNDQSPASAGKSEIQEEFDMGPQNRNEPAPAGDADRGNVPSSEGDAGDGSRNEQTASGDAADQDKPVDPAFDLADKDIGHHFFGWLKRGLTSKSIPINNSSAKCHIVEMPDGKTGILLVSPAIFKQFCSDNNLPSKHGTKDAYVRVQDRYGSKPGNNIRTSHGLNMHVYWVESSNRKTKLTGYVVPASEVYPEGSYPERNKYIAREIAATK